MNLENFNNIGIIGSSGFVGRSLIYYLESKNKKYSLISGDILTSDFKEQENNYDLIFHFAAYSSTSEFNINMYKTIIDGTANVIDFCKKNNSFLAYTSTLGIEFFYNENLKHRFDLQSIYNCSKLISEQLIRGSFLNYSIIRLPSLYSSINMMNKDALIYKFTFGNPIIIDGNKKYPIGNVDEIISKWCENLIPDFIPEYNLITISELFELCQNNYFNIKKHTENEF